MEMLSNVLLFVWMDLFTSVLLILLIIIFVFIYCKMQKYRGDNYKYQYQKDPKDVLDMYACACNGVSLVMSQ